MTPPPRAVYRICQTRHIAHNKTKNGDDGKKGIGKQKEEEEEGSFSHVIQGWLPFALQSVPVPVSVLPLLWHQLKHYNVIIKMTNRITHDGNRNSRWMDVNCTACLPGQGLLSLAHLAGAIAWNNLPIVRPIQIAALYTVLILCKPANDSQVSRVATECGKCDKVCHCRRWGTSATPGFCVRTTTMYNPLVMSPLVAYYRALRQLSIDFKILSETYAISISKPPITKERKKIIPITGILRM